MVDDDKRGGRNRPRGDARNSRNNGSGRVKRRSGELNDEESRLWSATLEGAARSCSVLLDALASIRPFRSSTVEVAGIDKYWRCGLGDKFFKYSQRERVGILIHECLHVVCNHNAREQAARQLNHRLANIAQDLEINQMIMEMPGVTLPSDALLPGRGGIRVPADKTMETYYTLLGGETGMRNTTELGQRGESKLNDRNNQQTQRSQSDSSQSGKQNQQSDGGQGSQDDNTDNTGNTANSANSERNASNGNTGNNGNSDSQGDNGDDNEGNGSGSRGGSPSHGLRRRPERGSCGNAASKRLEAEADDLGVNRASGAIRSKAKESVVERAKDPSSWGAGTAGRELGVKLVTLMTPPKVDWRAVFRKVITNAYSGLSYKRTEYSYRRINRRGNAFMKNVAFPGMVSYTPKALVAIDTSASMRPDELKSSLMELEGIIRQVGHGSKDAFRAFCVDTKMKNVQTVNRIEDIDLTGGGGTDMAPAFQYAGSLSRLERPDVFILVTDMGLDWNRVAKVWPHNIKVVILATSRQGFENTRSNNAWLFETAKVIDISDEDDYSYYQGR